MNKKLAKKILNMSRIDQKIRINQFGRHGEKAKKSSKEEIRKLIKNLKNLDGAHAKEMKKIIQHYGWPGKNLVGKKAAHMAWLLVQHADHDLVFQRRCLKLLRKAVCKNDAEKKDLAYLTDRVLIHEKKKQIYGTQFQGTKNGYRPFPISNPKNLEKKRKEMGLEPFAKYAKLFR